MSLLDEIKAEVATKGPVCTVCQLISTMSVKDQTDLQAALDDRNITGAQIARAVSRVYGTRIAPMTMNRHRREHGHGTL